MQEEIIIWHNKVCSTSRKAVALIEDNCQQCTIRDYIKNPPSISELKKVLEMMGQKPSYILRKKDKVYQELFSDQELSDEALLKAMHEHPSIIERPIVIIGKKAYLARPFDDFAAQLKNLL